MYIAIRVLDLDVQTKPEPKPTNISKLQTQDRTAVEKMGKKFLD